MAMEGLVIGIDAANLRQGGGRTHLIELLRASDPSANGVARVIVWAGRQTLDALGEADWLTKINPSALDHGLLRRTHWQRFSLSAAARAEKCDVLFVPGGSFAGDFHPVVTMCRNMLPFEWRELRRYGWSLTTLKLVLLRMSQAYAFRSADGVIFLTEHAQRETEKVTGPLRGTTTIIPHGLSSRFSLRPRSQHSIEEYSGATPFRLLYVSTVDRYKHQWHLVEAVAHLRRITGWPLTLDLVGPCLEPAMGLLQSTLRRVDAERSWVRYHGAVRYDVLHTMYAEAHLGVFASSCENMPNILLEMMASGLPIACSNRGPMPEMLQACGMYFDPEQPLEIASALRELVVSPELRGSLAAASHDLASSYSWNRCARDTLGFLVETARRRQAKSSTYTTA